MNEKLQIFFCNFVYKIDYFVYQNVGTSFRPCSAGSFALRVYSNIDGSAAGSSR